METGKHIQTQTEWEWEMSAKILDYIKSEIYLDFPFLGIALGILPPCPKEELDTFATDGENLYYSREQLLRVFEKNTRFLERAYLHSVLHCLFSHLWIAGERERGIWGIACDIVVEHVIDGMNKPSKRRALSFVRQQTYQELQKLSGFSAAAVYEWVRQCDRTRQERLFYEFYTDDHRFWPKEEQANAQMPGMAQQKWSRAARQTSMNQKLHGREEQEGERLLAEQVSSEKNHRNYRDFLKKFSVMREELHIDPDEFDLNYYTYGLNLYGNMPLLEPLESREARKIQEFVIVVDTSYSTSGELIQKFLEETFTILTEADSFFKKSRIRVLQCDERVLMDEVVKSPEEIERLMGRFTVVGGGGTDFRPAFSYVNELIEKGELRKVSGLLYFTDGKGIYPKKRPEYKSAFLFLDNYDETKVPAWAICLRLTPEAFGGRI